MTQKQTTVIYNLTAAVTLDEKLHSSDNEALAAHSTQVLLNRLSSKR